MKSGIALLILVLCLADGAWAFKARASTVHDGDSIKVRRSDKTLVTIRLYGVDAPELKQPFGARAKKRLAALAARQALDIEPVDTDRYGRTVALVRLKDGTLLNEVMVADGLAWVYGQYCDRDICSRLHELEAQARSDGRGLWAEGDPTRPSDWRKQHKTEEWYENPVRAIKKITRAFNRALRY